MDIRVMGRKVWSLTRGWSSDICSKCSQSLVVLFFFFFFFFFNDTATTEIYTLSLHDALPISQNKIVNLHPFTFHLNNPQLCSGGTDVLLWIHTADRKSTRLNSSHRCISYAVFCLKKKKPQNTHTCSLLNSHLVAHSTHQHQPLYTPH